MTRVMLLGARTLLTFLQRLHSLIAIELSIGASTIKQVKSSGGEFRCIITQYHVFDYASALLCDSP